MTNTLDENGIFTDTESKHVDSIKIVLVDGDCQGVTTVIPKLELEMDRLFPVLPKEPDYPGNLIDPSAPDFNTARCYRWNGYIDPIGQHVFCQVPNKSF